MRVRKVKNIDKIKLSICDKVGLGIKKIDNRVYFYTLSCPITNDIHYIGKTNDPLRRMRSYCGFRAHNEDLFNWISDLHFNSNVYPVMNIIQVAWSSDNCNQIEKDLIRGYGRNCYLFNICYTNSRQRTGKVIYW
jgi:hypothetical protein